MKWKYLGFVIVPIIGAVSILGNGWWTFSAAIFSYGIIPLIELLAKPDSVNLDAATRKRFVHSKFFDRVIYLVLPFYFILTYLFLNRLSSSVLSEIEILGIISSYGLMCGIMAINVGHELGHRRVTSERMLGEILLILAMQAHFLPYHNHGHHRYVATPNDPATARKNEAVFLFWVRSQIGSYIEAWRIEYRRLTQRNQSPWTLNNRMIRYSLAELSVLAVVGVAFGSAILLAYLTSCFIGMLLLETVNYIEHYGLLRQCDETGKYERVTPKHSWNSDHILGRVLLFELSRHSDHHANPSKHYQLLDSFEDSPQMPTGYPGMMLLSLIPPLWFKVMNKRINH